MSEELPLDEVTDLIASIEMHRKEIERESGLEASRSYALRRLQQALAQEQEALQQHGSSPVRLAAIETLNAEIRRIGSLARHANARPPQGGARPRPPQNFRQDGQRNQHNRPKSRGRRSMGRNSGR